MKIVHKTMKSLQAGAPSLATAVGILLSVCIILSISSTAQAAQNFRSGYAGMTDKEFMAAAGTAGDPHGGQESPSAAANLRDTKTQFVLASQTDSAIPIGPNQLSFSRKVAEYYTLCRARLSIAFRSITLKPWARSR